MRVAAIAVLVVVGVALGVLGLVIKALFWVAIIGVLLVVGAIGLGLWQTLRHNPSTPPRDPGM
jgi:protein-S-isoprenylcysteine O-methyltransferase Ste14